MLVRRCHRAYPWSHTAGLEHKSYGQRHGQRYRHALARFLRNAMNPHVMMLWSVLAFRLTRCDAVSQVLEVVKGRDVEEHKDGRGRRKLLVFVHGGAWGSGQTW